MSPEQHRQVSEIFLRAVELDGPARRTYLEQACGSDAELRRAVERLLARDAQPARLDTPLNPAGLRAAPAADTPHIPTNIGPYAIEGILGQGGMGTVFRARQSRPQRDVALKVLSAAYVTPEALRRFEFEAAVLGRLTHPGIAQIYEADIVDVPGRRVPYFAMELVAGRPLTDYANAAGLTDRQRLELLVRVCDAVAHAHQKGVIHRDLKPANILVSEPGPPRAGAAPHPQPKVLDFGVARAVEADGAQTQHTGVGQLVGTLPYMSPEQLAGDPALIDTRSDVYALGVVAFELLAGSLPFELAGRTMAECLDLLRFADPPRLSTRSARLRGDLETIVAKALAREKSQRYASVTAFAEDIQRYLRSEPILARPPSMAYHARLFTRRNRGLVLGAAAFVAALLLGIVATTWQSVRAARLQALAEASAERESAARRQAESEARKATEIKNFLQSMLVAASQNKGRGAGFTVREALDDAADRIDSEFGDFPDIRMELLLTLGEAYRGLGLFAESVPHLQAGLTLAQQVYGGDHPDLIPRLQLLGIALRETGDLAASAAAFERAYALSVDASGPDSSQARGLRLSLASLRQRLGDDETADRIFDEFAAADGLTAPDSKDALDVLSIRAMRLSDAGEWAGAEHLYREILTRLEAGAADERYAFRTFILLRLARVLHAQQRCAAALPLLEEVLERKRHALGPESAQVEMAQVRLATCLVDVGRRADGLTLADQTFEALRQPRTAESAVRVTACLVLGDLFHHAGQPEQAQAAARRGIEIAATMPPAAPGAECALQLAAWLAEAGQVAEAEQVLATTVGELEQGLIAQHPIAAACRRAWARALAQLGRTAEAETQLRVLLDQAREAFGPDDERTRRAAADLAALQESGQLPAPRPADAAASESQPE